MSKWQDRLFAMRDRLVDWLTNRLIELGGLLLIAIVVGLCLAIISYSPFDPSLNVASNTPVENWLGLAGAYASDLVLQIIGWGIAASFPSLLVSGWMILRHQPAPAGLIRRVFWTLLAMALVSAGLALSPWSSVPDGAQAGGALGYFLSNLILLGLYLLPADIHGSFVETAISLGLLVFSVPAALYAAGILTASSKQLVAAGRLVVRHTGWLTGRLIGTVRQWRISSENRGEDDAVSGRRARTAAQSADDAYDQEGDTDMGALARGQPHANKEAADAGGKKINVEGRRTALHPGGRDHREAQASLNLGDRKYKLPPLNLLTAHRSKNPTPVDRASLEANARLLENVLSDFGIRGEISRVRPGPVVTLYEFEPAAGVRSSRVVGLADDVARSMSAVACRVAPVPGASTIGIELPNQHRELVSLRELLASSDFERSKSRLTLALGKDIGGDPILTDLAKMPHLLVAGTTGSGKSVGINTMILSLLYRMTPEECRLIMVDPKMLELSVYDGIPHLLAPVVTEPKKAVVALKWVVKEMEDRYRKMSKVSVRNIEGYNERMRAAIANQETLTRQVQTGFNHETGEPVFETQEIGAETLPFIVVIIDEMADLMMVAGKEIEGAVQRLAQMARAAGIHLITATQRPSVDVITGTIKANFPSRISFQVTSRIDSRTVLGEQGAEQLLGQGDMLFMGGGGRLQRVHGPFVSDQEVEKVVGFLKKQGHPEYIESVTEAPDEEFTPGETASADSLYDEAVAIVTRDGKASTSYVQRRLQIGYNRAARLIEQMEEQGVISAPNHAGKREILVGKV